MVKSLRAAALMAAAVALSVTTMIFSSIPLLLFRRKVGGRAYWLWSALVTCLLGLSGHPQLWAPFLTTGILVGLYSELESHHFGMESSGIISLLGTCRVVGIISAALIRLHDIQIGPFVKAKVTEMVAQVRLAEPSLKLDVEALTLQVPSALIIALMLSLWLGLIVERRFRKVQGDETAPELSSFRVPDVFIWLLLASIIGAFFDFGSALVQNASTNAINVLTMIYFLQGLAIVGTFFKVQKVGMAWRALGYAVFIGQLFILVSAVGFVDYWLDFRRRLSKKSAESIGEV